MERPFLNLFWFLRSKGSMVMEEPIVNLGINGNQRDLVVDF